MLGKHTGGHHCEQGPCAIFPHQARGHGPPGKVPPASTACLPSGPPPTGPPPGVQPQSPQETPHPPARGTNSPPRHSCQHCLPSAGVDELLRFQGLVLMVRSPRVCVHSSVSPSVPSPTSCHSGCHLPAPSSQFLCFWVLPGHLKRDEAGRPQQSKG